MFQKSDKEALKKENRKKALQVGLYICYNQHYNDFLYEQKLDYYEYYEKCGVITDYSSDCGLIFFQQINKLGLVGDVQIFAEEDFIEHTRLKLEVESALDIGKGYIEKYNIQLTDRTKVSFKLFGNKWQKDGKLMSKIFEDNYGIKVGQLILYNNLHYGAIMDIDSKKCTATIAEERDHNQAPVILKDIPLHKIASHIVFSDYYSELHSQSLIESVQSGNKDYFRKAKNKPHFQVENNLWKPEQNNTEKTVQTDNITIEKPLTKEQAVQTNNISINKQLLKKYSLSHDEDKKKLIEEFATRNNCSKEAFEKLVQEQAKSYGYIV